MSRKVVCDIVGLCIVAIGTILAVWALIPFDVLGNAKVVAMIATPTLIGAALYTWYVSKTGQKNDTDAWMGLTLFSPLIGAVSFAIDVLVGSIHGHYSNFVQAASHAGGPFGIVVTVLICPIGTIISAGSWARSALLDHFFSNTVDEV